MKTDFAVSQKAINLADSLFYYSRQTPDANALYCQNRNYTFKQFAESAFQVVTTLNGLLKTVETMQIGVLGGRSYECYAAVMGILWSGHSYVPLVAGQPVEHINKLLEKAGIKVLIVDEEGEKKLEQLKLPEEIIVVTFGNLEKNSGTTISAEKIPAESPTEPKRANPNSPAYIIFTSGTTGEPKGCAPTHAQVGRFIDAMRERYHFDNRDRFGQFCELAFDASVFVLFTALSVGACTYVLPRQQRLMPIKFLRNCEISVFYMMPSVVSLLKSSFQIKENLLPQLRLCFFGAETLTEQIVFDWKKVASNTMIENFYGPTESTVSCSAYSIQFENGKIKNPAQKYERDTLPIGTPLPGIQMGVIDDKNQFLADNKTGQIVISGDQVLQHYWRDSRQTQKAFSALEHSEYGDQIWYLSGDLGYRDSDGDYHLLGRMDNQIQLRGQRLEPDYIQMLLRRYAQTDLAIVIPWQEKDGIVMAMVAIVEKEHINKQQLFSQLKQELAENSLPSYILNFPTIPRNSNGKVDFSALKSLCASALDETL